MGDLAAGDQVFDERGMPCRVLAVSETWQDRPCYRVTFSDGEQIVADAEHEWLTLDRRGRKSAGRRLVPLADDSVLARVRTTAEIAASLYDGKEVNHAVGVCRPLYCPEADLPVQPYTLGAWLGDGTRIRAEITCADPEILDSIRADGYDVIRRESAPHAYYIGTPGCRWRSRDEATGRLVSHEDNLLGRLKRLGVVEQKHIPTAYLRASESQRRALLCGLMDTDGYIGPSGTCEFVSISPRLAADVYELVVSLGIKAAVGEGDATLNGRVISRKYRVCFTPYQPVFRLSRKANLVKQPGKQAARQRRRFIVAVDPVPSEPTRCIEVESPSHLYLAGRGMIPTHNSFIGAYDLITRACRNRGRLYLVVAPNYPLLKSASIRTFLGLATKLGKLKSYNKTDFLATLDSDSQVMFRSAETPNSLRGPNISGLWMDEAQGSDLEAFNVAIGCLREDPHLNWCTCTFTPRGKLHWTYERFGRLNPDGTNVETDTELFKCSTRDNPFVPPSLAESMARQYTSARRDQEIEGEFVDVGGTIFKREWWDGQIVDVSPRVGRRVRYWDKACLVSDTKILTRRGQIPIEQVIIGDEVLTRLGWKRVLRSWLTMYVDRLATVRFSNSSVLTGTADHRVWTENRGWADLDSFSLDDWYLTTDGARSSGHGTGIVHTANPVPVYDLEVEDAHEFFANGVLVHNSSKDGGCYTCGVLMSQATDGYYYVENVIRGQWSTFERDQVISLTAQLDQEKHGYGAVRIYVEQEPGSGGQDSLRSTLRQLSGYIVGGDRPSGTKRVRAEPLASQCEARNVFLVRDPFFNWIPDYVDELSIFPEGKFCDQVDASSGAFNQLTRGVYSTPAVGGHPPGGPSPPGGVSVVPAQGAPAAQNWGLAGLPTSGLGNFKPR